MNKYVHVIKIAELYITIDLSKISDPLIRDQLNYLIKSYYRLELLQRNLHAKVNTNFYIYFVAKEEFKFVNKSQKKPLIIDYYLHVFSIGKNRAYINYHAGIAYFQYMLKIILQTLLGKHKGFILHTSAVSDGKYACLFLGPSGIGKSTVVHNLKSEFTPFADDMLVVRKINNKWLAFQLPLEKEPYKKINELKIPIKSLCYLKQGNRTNLIKLSSAPAIKKLLTSLVSIGSTELNLKFLFEFLNSTDHYLFETPKKTNAEVVRKILRNSESKYLLRS